ncbi:uncharacterized protein TRIADDRAFT_32533 [Trichoplax adhaerens]|uniref:phosphoglycerate mutase (2,3-diphosphoglycerate-independent) n=1 Tax=Trichoplax adhaerens TaxID=10228 RepID=B3SB43_TRIAD|nr:hypothetical protein TRIADDRAFT_32533 [Trichoplax adhaerens]EDV20042.1 hypothetical protein TRIADDRAFT_32533 [Trichoplax adhaerens]|eukprot:XP_002117426.1 hypothetical protein TRIADDRAFT_32533 [Trichoplax adhaerens]
MASQVKQNVCLIVIDGWGITDTMQGNAIANAQTPVMDKLQKEYAFHTLEASGLAVGLPAGVMGNSEVGHTTIGSGRAMFQDLVKINLSIQEDTLKSNKSLTDAMARAKNGNGRLHFLGLVSDGGVHSHIDHLLQFLRIAKDYGVPKSFIQFFSDGRDTSPTSGVTFVQKVLNYISEMNYGSLATVVGRYYAMDRDKRYDRIQIAYEGLVKVVGELTSPGSITEVMTNRYNAEGSQRQTDEFMTPIISDPEGRISNGDTLVFIDFRADRMRQISEAFGMQPQFSTDVVPTDLHVATMTQYKKQFPFPVLFPPTPPDNVIAEWLSKKELSQMHVAETEKYAHVTFFFNGGREMQFSMEDRIMVPSPKVATYDLKPEMNAEGVADEVIRAIESGKYPFVMCNFAPPDMVGHTGVYDAAVIACTVTDFNIGRIFEACEKHDYALMITADHGNAEKMVTENGSPFTAHTLYRVPLIMTRGKYKDITHDANLSDVAPTVLRIMGLDVPPEMSGQSLLAE